MSTDSAKYVRRRCLLWSGDRLPGGSLTSYTVVLKTPIERVVAAEWVSCSVAGVALQIREMPMNSYITNNQLYWRFVDAYNNGYSTRWDEQRVAPFTVRQFTINWLAPDGTAATGTVTANHSIELEFLCEA